MFPSPLEVWVGSYLETSYYKSVFDYAGFRPLSRLVEFPTLERRCIDEILILFPAPLEDWGGSYYQRRNLEQKIKESFRPLSRIGEVPTSLQKLARMYNLAVSVPSRGMGGVLQEIHHGQNFKNN